LLPECTEMRNAITNSLIRTTKQTGLKIYKSKPNVVKISVKTHCLRTDAVRPVDEFPDLDSVISIHITQLS